MMISSLRINFEVGGGVLLGTGTNDITLNGTVLGLTSNGAGNDISLTSADDIVFNDTQLTAAINLTNTATSFSSGDTAIVDAINAAWSAAGGGTGGNAVFQTITGTAGTNPVADTTTDTLTLTSASGALVITGTAGTDTLDFDIADGGIVENDLAASLVFDDGDLFNFSAINASSATEGLILPQATDTSAATAEGQIAWDTDGDFLTVGNGTTATTILTSTSGLITLDGDDADTETLSGGDTLLIAGGASLNTDVSATDTITIDITDDSVNFDELSDTLALDADTSIAFDAAEALTFTSAASSTETAGILDLNFSAGNAAVDGINLAFTVDDGATAGTNFTAQEILLTANDADADVLGISITGAATANAAAGSYEAGLFIDNAENTAASMTDAILITLFWNCRRCYRCH